jgi:hypothetical protein
MAFISFTWVRGARRYIIVFFLLSSVISKTIAPDDTIGLNAVDLALRLPKNTAHLIDRRQNGGNNNNANDIYSCGILHPCGNGACCGESGFCGFGPTYCGTGCTSNCNAKAPCGQYSEGGNTLCPLNVCCSQWGFCGTTSVSLIVVSSNSIGMVAFT